MTWDLRGALLKKGEMESSRLMDFEFRLGARTIRLLAESLGGDCQQFVARIIRHSDEKILQMLALETSQPLDVLKSQWLDCNSKARAALILERGNPAPFKLA